MFRLVDLETRLVLSGIIIVATAVTTSVGHALRRPLQSPRYGCIFVMTALCTPVLSRACSIGWLTRERVAVRSGGRRASMRLVLQDRLQGGERNVQSEVSCSCNTAVHADTVHGTVFGL